VWLIPLVQVVKLAVSRAHLKVTGDEVSVKAKAAEVEVVGLDGSEEAVMVGAAGLGAARAASTKKPMATTPPRTMRAAITPPRFVLRLAIFFFTESP
jgi:hypothetical protein